MKLGGGVVRNLTKKKTTIKCIGADGYSMFAPQGLVERLAVYNPHRGNTDHPEQQTNWHP